MQAQSGGLRYWGWAMDLFGPRWPCLEEGIVNLKSGTAFRGVIWQRRAGFLVLRNAVLLVKGQKGTPVDGEVLVAERDVEFVQVVVDRAE
jgi:hypothetical protein